jgi:hypothetical protein
MVETPVALIIFNRPATTRRVFMKIAEARPRQLFVIADGPRPNHPDDAQQCAAARAVVESVDWPCTVVTTYAETNLGCGKRPATGLDWLFQRVDRAIILEDDCVPDLSFFRLCDELLEKYQDDQRIMMIGGTSLWPIPTAYSYNFSYHHSNCGWATWRRAWQHFDAKVTRWPTLRGTTWLRDLVEHPVAVEFWTTIFDQAYAAAGEADYWDYQWTFAVWAHDGLAITPGVNLVTNIGFAAGATHPYSLTDRKASLPTTPISFPLVHPPMVIRHVEEDRLVFSLVPNLCSTRLSKIYSLLPEPFRTRLGRRRPNDAAGRASSTPRG